MNKIWNSLGLAVLGIALLVGAAAADDVQLEGCYFPEGYLELDVSELLGSSTALDFGIMAPSDTTTTLGGKLKVRSENLGWDLAVIEKVGGTVDGKMENGATSLTNALGVKIGGAEATPLSGSATSIVTDGSANADCEYQETTIDYSQQVVAGDTVGGTYSIALTYTLSNS